jgi:N-methylhydantoinase A/oxoprolinase/acetone carboxylase beta subunit
MYKIGVDVGGTNTDAVILDEQNELVSAIKTPTTEDVSSGIRQAIHNVIQESTVDAQEINYAMLGTTQCTNAIVERKKLDRVGVIRLAYPATGSVPPFTGWPEDISNLLDSHTANLHGGYEYTGATISDFDEVEVRELLNSWAGEIDSLAVIGVFSSVNNDQEFAVETIAKEIYGDDFPVSKSSQIGSVGFLDRENSTILNASLQTVMNSVTVGFKQAQVDEGITNAAIFICQNDGTLMSVDYAEEFPILTIACGPSNSIRGAAYLANKKNAITLDVGGTTSDLGVLANSFPRQSSLAVSVGGVRTNFRMPDILSIGLGGGTIIHVNGDEVTVGPDSVGYKLLTEAKVFGGDIITATDIAVKLGRANIGNKDLVEDIPMEVAKEANAIIKQMVEEAIDSMKTDAGDAEIVLVGGGSIIIPDEIKGVSTMFRDENGAVANAIGASISQISGEFEQLYVYAEQPREESIKDATEKASGHALDAGALNETIEVAEIEEIPLAYAEGNANRVRVKVIGDMA